VGGGGGLYNMQISYKAATAHIIAYEPRRRGVCSCEADGRARVG